MLVRPLAFFLLVGLPLAVASRAADPTDADKESAPRLKTIADSADPLSTHGNRI